MIIFFNFPKLIQMDIYFVLDGGYVEYIAFFFSLSFATTRNFPTKTTEVTVEACNPKIGYPRGG